RAPVRAGCKPSTCARARTWRTRSPRSGCETPYETLARRRPGRLRSPFSITSRTGYPMTKAQVARALRMAALVAAALGLAHAASAQRPSEEQIAAIRAACRSDYIAHCAGVPPGGAQALACLREHLGSVSPDCQQAVNAAGAAPSSAPAAQAPAP